MIQNLTRQDLVRLIRGCEPGMEYVGMLQQHGLGAYVGGMNDHWEWASKDSDHWFDVGEEELWTLYTTITGDERDEYSCTGQVYVVMYDDEYDKEPKAIFTDQATAERYKDADGSRGLLIEAFDLNPHFEELEQVWEASLLPETMDLDLFPECQAQHKVGYIRRGGDYLHTWFIAKNRTEAMAKANAVFRTVIRGREQGKFRFLNQKIYIPDYQFPEIKKYPYYDVASGRIVMGDWGTVLLPKEEGLLPDGTPNPDLFILLERHFVDTWK